jgi:hypothetical protein
MRRLITVAILVNCMVLTKCAVETAQINNNIHVMKNCDDLHVVTYKLGGFFGPKAECVSLVQKYGPVFTPTPVED